MKIKLYEDVTVYPYEGKPYHKIGCFVFETLDELGEFILQGAIANIDSIVDECINESGDIDPDDYEIVEPKWIAEAKDYIKAKRYGWNILKEHMEEASV